MRVTRSVILVLPVFFLPFQVNSQQATATAYPQRDSQAVALLHQSMAAMAPILPADSTAAGSITITAGSQTTQGTLNILTRGSAETAIQVQTPGESWSVIYASGQANRVDSTSTTVLPLELSASSQCLYFPLPYLAGLIANPDVSIQFVAQETIDGSVANHIHVQNTFNSSPPFQFLSEFTIADIWLDATGGLPLRIAMTRRHGGGSSPRIPISFSYSNYQTVSGVRYPFTIQEYITGTLWATTTIQSVTFNSGLTDNSFPIAEGVN
jgi:hypothetical protein